MIVVVFRSRLRPEAEGSYRDMAGRLGPLAMGIPGYVAHKAFTADDGERVTIVEYESEEAVQAWGRHPAHVEGKRAGIRSFFSEYRVQICELRRERRSPTAGA
jgi:heme-degrading monooxygenase HmoA